MINVVVNGRFLTRDATGVDRVAEEFLRAVDAMTRVNDSAVEGFRFRIAKPRTSIRSLGLSTVPETLTGRLDGHPWEQLELPSARRGDEWLVNPCNTGPVRVARSLTILHDAQVYLTPQSYSRAFRAIYRLLLPALGRRSTAITTVSGFSRDRLEEFGVVPKGKAIVVPNGCDHIDRVEPAREAPGGRRLTESRYFLVLGSLSSHKNLATILAANARRSTRDRVPLVVAGGQNPRVFSRSDLPHADEAIFLGRVTDAELKSLYNHATALVFPSLFEGFGLPPLEAMRCGCPVIASTADAVVESCGDAASYVAPLDVDGWAVAMDAMAADPTLREPLIEAGRRRAALFTWRSAALQYLEVLRASG